MNLTLGYTSITMGHAYVWLTVSANFWPSYP